MTQTLQDEKLLKLCLLGDHKAWTIFVDRFSPLVRWAVRSKIKRFSLPIAENEIDDIFQQIFTDIWRSNRLKALRSASSLSAWLVITSQNATVSFARKKRSIFNQQARLLNEDILHGSSNPRTEAETNQLYKTVDELISSLPLKEQRIISLELFYDLRHRDIADLIGIPLNTVSTIISRIKQDLKAKLSKRGYNVR